MEYYINDIKLIFLQPDEIINNFTENKIWEIKKT